MNEPTMTPNDKWVRIRFHRKDHFLDGHIFAIIGSNCDGTFRIRFEPGMYADQIPKWKGAEIKVTDVKPEEVEPC